MAIESPVKDPAGPSNTTVAAAQLESSPNATATPSAKSDSSAPDSKKTPVNALITPRSLEQPSNQLDVINIPSYSRWFSWNDIHNCEIRFLPEFFDGRSPSKNPRVYMYYRNSIVRVFRENPTMKITFTDVRKTIVGDVGSIRRVFDFLEAWGLINYSGAALKHPLKWEERENKSSQSGGDVGGSSVETSVPNRETTRKLCNGCKTLCSIACFACDKFDLTLCARCYVRGNYRVGVSSSDFRRVEISEEAKTNWTDTETLHLLEAIMHYGDDWKRVAEHVGGRSEKDCVARFIKLPFGEQYVGHIDSEEIDNKFNKMKERNDTESGLESIGKSSSTKRMRLSPLADASNPIMAQAAFLVALVGEEVAKAAAQAAVRAVSELDYRANRDDFQPLANDTRQQEDSTTLMEKACLDANSLLEKEELETERAISSIAEVQMKYIFGKIVHFEKVDLQMEKKWQQLQQMKDLLFVDQRNLLFHKNAD